MRTSLICLLALGCSGPEGSDIQTDPTVEPAVESPQLDEAITESALMAHLEAFQAIADANDGNRAVGTSGYAASVDYAVGVLEGAGYTVEREAFSFSGWQEVAPAVLEVPASGLTFEAGTDMAAMSFSAPGEVTAEITAVDLVLPPTSSSSSTSGCEAGDFSGFPAGNIALIQRGTCLFQDKALAAQDAGASAVVLFNEGQSGRTELDAWTLEDNGAVMIPVLGASFATGDALAAALEGGPLTVHLISEGQVVTQNSENVVVHSGGDPDRVIVVGGHLDSVPAGPGINDNGSGSALVLEMAVQLAESGHTPQNQVRFALWGAEEVGLLGSTAHVDGQDADGLDRIVANLNFDMVGSVNGSSMIYDGDGDEYGGVGPDGSDEIEQRFIDWFDERDEPWFPTVFDGRSDYWAFIAEGIPAGGLFSGADYDLTSAEASVTGGDAGSQRDPCYHRSCDTLDNIDRARFLELSQAAAQVTVELADDVDLAAGFARTGPEFPVVHGQRSCTGHAPARR